MAELVGRVEEALEQVRHRQTQDEAVRWHSQVRVTQDGEYDERVAADDGHCDDAQCRVVETATDVNRGSLTLSIVQTANRDSVTT